MELGKMVVGKVVQLNSLKKAVRVNVQRMAFDPYTIITHRYSSSTLSALSASMPYKLVQSELDSLHLQINNRLLTPLKGLYNISQYHFDGCGKFFRPLVIMLIARACNLSEKSKLTEDQKDIAMIAEMIHTASLLHDDIIDESDLRRGKITAHREWGQNKAILAGDYILSVASMCLACIGNVEVVRLLSQVLEDLITGEFMQLGSKENDSERFSHYMKKTYKKTASLIANSCKAVSVLAGCNDHFKNVAFEFGKHIGLAFQIVDDLLDFTSTSEAMGKPGCADLKLGLATAPVLFAALQYPEINSMIMRRFKLPGDIATTLDLIYRSDGIEKARTLANQHAKEAIRQVMLLPDSDEQRELVNLTNRVLDRFK